MKKTLFVLSILIAGAGSAVAQKKAPVKKPVATKTAAAKPAGNYLRGTIGSKAHSATGSQVYTYATLYTSHNPAYQEIAVFNETSAPTQFAVRFYLADGEKLAPGTYPLSSLDNYENTFPGACITLTENETKDQKFSLLSTTTSSGSSSGTVTVTAVSGGFVEGTFEVNMNDHDEQRNITNGSFRFKMPVVEKE